MRGNSETYPAKCVFLGGQSFTARTTASVQSMMSDDPNRFVGWAYQYLSTSSKLPLVLFEPHRTLALAHFETSEAKIPRVSWKPRR